jgi:hypothetical protein
MTNTNKKPTDIAASGQDPSRHPCGCIDTVDRVEEVIDPLAGLSEEHIAACREAAKLDTLLNLQLALALAARGKRHDSTAPIELRAETLAGNAGERLNRDGMAGGNVAPPLPVAHGLLGELE